MATYISTQAWKNLQCGACKLIWLLFHQHSVLIQYASKAKPFGNSCYTRGSHLSKARYEGRGLRVLPLRRNCICGLFTAGLSFTQIVLRARATDSNRMTIQYGWLRLLAVAASHSFLTPFTSLLDRHCFPIPSGMQGKRTVLTSAHPFQSLRNDPSPFLSDLSVFDGSGLALTEPYSFFEHSVFDTGLVPLHHLALDILMIYCSQCRSLPNSSCLRSYLYVAGGPKTL